MPDPHRHNSSKLDHDLSSSIHDTNTSKENRVTVKCDKIVKESAEEWLNEPTSNAHLLGFYSMGDIVTKAMRDFMEKYPIPPEKPSHFYLPNLKDKKMSFDLDVYEKKIVCNVCTSETCIHIQTLDRDKIAKKYLNQHLEKKELRKNKII